MWLTDEQLTLEEVEGLSQSTPARVHVQPARGSVIEWGTTPFAPAIKESGLVVAIDSDMHFTTLRLLLP